MDDILYRLTCLRAAMAAACTDVSGMEDPVLAHFTQALGDVCGAMADALSDGEVDGWGNREG